MQSYQDISLIELSNSAPRLNTLKNTIKMSSGNSAFSLYNIRKDINKVESIAALWRLLFREGALDLFSILVKYGYHPTSFEMNQNVGPDGTNAWFWVAKHSEFISLFQTLLNMDILPSTETLAACNSSDNSNAWFWLASGDKERITIFKMLLDKNIVPSAENLAQCNSKDNTSCWYWLARDDERVAIFKMLLDKNIIPRAEDLAQCNSKNNLNVWHWLAEHNEHVVVFKMLLNKNIIPRAEDLAKRDSHNHINTWFWLAKHDQGISILNILLDKNILPSEEDYSTIQQVLDQHKHGHGTEFIRRMNQVKQFNKKYNLVGENKIANLLTDENKLNCHSFLYIFYLVAKEKRSTIDCWSHEKSILDLPIEVLFMIGEYFLPHTDLIELKNESNRLAFTKFHVIHSIDNRFSWLSSFFNSTVAKAAENLKSAVEKEQEPENLHILFKNQLRMFQPPSLPDVKPKSTKDTKREAYVAILNDGYSLSKP